MEEAVLIWPPQTDPDFYGWAFAFPEPRTPDWRQVYAEEHLRWLEMWNPPQEWMQ